MGSSSSCSLMPAPCKLEDNFIQGICLMQGLCDYITSMCPRWSTAKILLIQ